MVDKLLQGIRSTDTSIASVEFLSGLISSIHAAAQLDYANQNSGNKRQYVSAMGSNDQRGGRGRARQWGGRIGERSGRSGGRGRGRGNER